MIPQNIRRTASIVAAIATIGLLIHWFSNKNVVPTAGATNLRLSELNQPANPLFVPMASANDSAQLDLKGPSVMVLVALKGEYKPEGNLKQATRKAQRAAIAAAQNRVIAGIGAQTGDKPLRNAAAQLKRRFVTIPGLALEIKPELITQLRALPDVAAVTEDRLNYPTLDVTTNIIGSRMANTTFFGVTGRGQVVAVLDTGVDRNHPFLGDSRFVGRACFSTNSWFTNDFQSLCPNGHRQQTGGESAQPCSISGCDHGTHVAGIVGGFIDTNHNGVIDLDDQKGVAPEVKFIAIQVFTKTNKKKSCDDVGKPTPCLTASDSDVLAGLDQVASWLDDYAIAAVNLSLGGGNHTVPCDVGSFLDKWAIDNLRSRGTATVIASGNDGFTNALASPACISSAISVGNTMDNDVVNSSSDTASFLKLLAPGTNVNSSLPGGGFGNKTGTSMAAPHVAGAWALMKQFRSSRSQPDAVADILGRLQSTGVGITSNGVTTPRVDVMSAMNFSSVEVRSDGSTLQVVDALPISTTINLVRRNTSAPFNIVAMVEGDNAGDFTFSFSNNSTTGNGVTMTVMPALSANGNYTLRVGGTVSPSTGVFAARVPLSAIPPAPVVSGFTPNSGPPTTFITINGQNFSRITQVQFSGTNRVVPTVFSSTSIRVGVPVGTVTGPIRVFNGNRFTDAANFTVTNQPAIVRVTPNFAPTGAHVVVEGLNFGTTPTVTINDVAVTGLAATNTSLNFNVPITAAGTHILKVHNSQGDATAGFTIGMPVPTISSFSPQVGGVGSVLTIFGAGYYRPQVGVLICGKSASQITILSANEIHAKVPSGIANSCVVKVTTRGGSVVAAKRFVNGL